MFLEFDFSKKHEKSVANSWEREIGREIVRLGKCAFVDIS